MKDGIEASLASLEEKILGMASLASTAIKNSINGLVSGREEILKRVIVDDKYINDLEIQIDSMGIECLARYQPEASDLRFVVSVLRIDTDIERIGDYAVNISKASLRLIDKPLLNIPLIDIPYLAETCLSMLENVISAFVTKDAILAKSVLAGDEKVDEICDQIFREVLTYMMENPKLISRCIQLILISRHLERIADHSTNIAESVIFMVEGKIVKHHFEEI
jgi:phosphate transport system protein